MPFILYGPHYHQRYWALQYSSGHHKHGKGVRDTYDRGSGLVGASLWLLQLWVPFTLSLCVVVAAHSQFPQHRIRFHHKIKQKSKKEDSPPGDKRNNAKSKPTRSLNKQREGDHHTNGSAKRANLPKQNAQHTP